MVRETTSASNIDRRYRCPGSERLEAGLPEEQSEQSEEGVLLHKHMAKPELSRSKLKPAERDVLEANERIVREFYERVSARFGDDLPISTFADNITWYLHRGIKSLFPGHPDAGEYRPNKLLIVLDFKFGRREVSPASANLQLRSYACMGAELYDSDNVVVGITQPRLPADMRLTMAVYTRADIEASRQQLYQIWDAAKAPDAPLVAGEEQCMYCKAKTICPAFRESVTSAVAIVPSVTGLTKPAREARIEERIAQASDAELAKLYDAVHLAGFVKDPLFDEIRERIRAGGMEGYRLGKETEVREITDPVQAIRLLEQSGFDRDQVERRAISKFSIGAIEELHRELHGGTWQHSRDEVNTLLASTIERKSKKPSIEKVKALPA